MSRNSPFMGSVRNLFAGKAQTQPPEDDNDANGVNASEDEDDKPAPTGKGPTEAQVNAVVVAEREKATKAANERWNTVMTSDKGMANPAQATKLLMKTTMSAEDVIDTLDDAGTTASREQRQNHRELSEQRQAERNALENDDKTDPDTGAAAGSPQQRRGEGDDRKSQRQEATKSRREARAERQNARVKGGKAANADNR